MPGRCTRPREVRGMICFLAPLCVLLPQHFKEKVMEEHGPSKPLFSSAATRWEPSLIRKARRTGLEGRGFPELMAAGGGTSPNAARE